MLRFAVARSVSNCAALIDSGMGLPSLPFAAVTASDGASATGFTVIATARGGDEARWPAVLVAVTVRLTTPANSVAGLKVSPDSCAGVSVQLPPPLLVPAESVASLGTPVMVIDTVSRASNGVSL